MIRNFSESVRTFLLDGNRECGCGEKFFFCFFFRSDGGASHGLCRELTLCDIRLAARPSPLPLPCLLALLALLPSPLSANDGYERKQSARMALYRHLNHITFLYYRTYDQPLQTEKTSSSPSPPNVHAPPQNVHHLRAHEPTDRQQKQKKKRTRLRVELL